MQCLYQLLSRACAGSVRENVDPLGQHYDAAILDALKGVALLRACPEAVCLAAEVHFVV